MPARKAVSDLPADAQYHELSCVKVPKYSSITILPSFNTMNALVLLLCRNSRSAGISSVHHPNVAGSVLSHVSPVVGGKYNSWANNNTGAHRRERVRLRFMCSGWTRCRWVGSIATRGIRST